MNYFDDVAQFHQKMGLPVSAESVTPVEASQTPGLLKESDFRFRLAFLHEEIRELIEGNSVGDLVQVADALVDIVYVALGTAHYAGIPFDALWKEVQRANMEKRPWKDGDPIKPRNTTGLEVVKPEGWRPPDIKKIIRDFQTVHGFRKPPKSDIRPDETIQDFKERKAAEIYNEAFGKSLDGSGKPFVLDEGAFGGELDPYSPGAQDPDKGPGAIG